MALLPLMLDLADDIDFAPSPYRRRGNDFGLGIYPSEFIQPRYFTLNHANRDRSRSRVNKSQIGKDGFQVCMDVQDFAPNEISVKTVGNSIVVEGNHEEKQDEHGYISRQFTRRYALPNGYNAKDVVSTLSSDGVLTVKAPPEAKSLEKGNERVIQIQQTGPAHLSIGDNKEKTLEKTPESAEVKNGK